MRKAKSIYSECWNSGESAIVTCVWQRLRQAEEWESFTEELREGCRCALIGDHWPGVAGGGQVGVGLYVIG